MTSAMILREMFLQPFIYLKKILHTRNTREIQSNCIEIDEHELTTRNRITIIICEQL